MKVLKLIIVISIISLCTCSGNADNYSKHKSGLEYRIIKASDNSKELNIGDIVELHLKYSNQNDSVLFNSKEFTASFKMKLKPSSHKGGSFEDALNLMHVGDKYEFLIKADSFFVKTKHTKIPEHINPDSKLKFEVEIVRLVDSTEIAKERRIREKQMQRQEKLLLMQYINDNNITQAATKSGLYYIEKKTGKGNKIELGDSLHVHYVGKLLSGEVFDSSYKRNEEFTFVLGDQNIIEAWNEGFSYMKKGGEAIFIIPSNLAYGNKWYSTIIPPFSSLIFEVKLVNVN